MDRPRPPWLSVALLTAVALALPDARFAETEQVRLARRADVPFFAEYRDLDEINAHLEALARKSRIARTHVIGVSSEGRPIHAITISRDGQYGIVINGAQHAREWISAMVPLCIADRLAVAQNDPKLGKLLRVVSFHIVPVVNPDGYAYSWSHDRMWRKTRRGGYGVDLNRNFGVGWGGRGGSDDRSSPNYRGEHAFSEPESRAIRALIEREAVRAHVDFHSYSQVIVYPWSHTTKPPPDRDRLAAIADRMASAIMATHGERYRIAAGADVGIGGTMSDWVYEATGGLSYLVELRPRSSAGGGFKLPPDQIVPTCDEAFAAVIELAKEIAQRP